MPEIKINISTDGDVCVEALGITGEACTSLTADVERALGRVRERQDKVERFLPAGQDATQDANAAGQIGGGW